MTEQGTARLTLVLGGARSGKSRHAETLVMESGLAPIYIATAEARDDEMRARIAHHRARRGPGWTTIEEPLALAAQLTVQTRPDRIVLVDCLTLWLSNLLCAERDVAAEIDALLAALPPLTGPVVLVANEVGLGIVPENALARAFRDHAGRLNQGVAALAEHVVLLTAGLPLMLKEDAARHREEAINRRHAEKMAKHKTAHDKIVAGKTEERGLLIVHTGNGKGKSTAGFGLVMRCIGHDMRVGMVQFIKGTWETGERRVLAQFPDLVTHRAMGEGFTWETQDRARDIAAARAAWEAATAMMADPSYRLILLDELNIVLRYEYLPLDEIVATLRARRAGLHVVVTGRNAKPELIEIADLVTEMSMIKHPFRAGVKAQAGIEF